MCGIQHLLLYYYIPLTDVDLNDSGTDDGEKIISLLRSFVVEVITLITHTVYHVYIMYI